MRGRFLGFLITTAMTATAAGAVISVSIDRASAQAAAGSVTTPAPALKTPWGEPDLQGIWTDETQTSLQRPARYADQEFFTPEQRAELDNLRADILSRERRGQRGTEADVAGAYNSAFVTMKHIGARTSLIVDPPNGRLPALTAEAQRNAAADREFRLALLQATETCREKSGGCAGGTYDPKALAAPRRASAALQHDTHESPRRSGRRLSRGALPDPRVAGIRRLDQQLPAHRADSRRHHHVL